MHQKYQDEAYKTLCGNSKHRIKETIASLKAAGRERKTAVIIEGK
jgi:hypothetical protein